MTTAIRSNSFSSMNGWITPEEQMSEIADQIPEEEIQETNLAKTLSATNHLPSSLNHIIVRYVAGFDPKYRIWYALKDLNAFPDKIPRLDFKIFKTLKEEEEVYQIKHVVLLIPTGLNHFATFQDIIKDYKDFDLTQYLSDITCAQFGDIGPGLPQTQWVVFTSSLGTSFFKKFKHRSSLADLIENPTQKIRETYEIPSFRTVSIATLVYFIAIREILYDFPIRIQDETNPPRAAHAIFTATFNLKSAKTSFQRCSECSLNHDTALVRKFPANKQKSS